MAIFIIVVVIIRAIVTSKELLLFICLLEEKEFKVSRFEVSIAIIKIGFLQKRLLQKQPMTLGFCQQIYNEIDKNKISLTPILEDTFIQDTVTRVDD